MAMGVHAPAPIPRLRRASSTCVGCFSYRRHYSVCAVPTETCRKGPALKETSGDRGWNLQTEFERRRNSLRADDDHERLKGVDTNQGNPSGRSREQQIDQACDVAVGSEQEDTYKYSARPNPSQRGQHETDAVPTSCSAIKNDCIKKKDRVPEHLREQQIDQAREVAAGSEHEDTYKYSARPNVSQGGQLETDAVSTSCSAIKNHCTKKKDRVPEHEDMGEQFAGPKQSSISLPAADDVLNVRPPMENGCIEKEDLSKSSESVDSGVKRAETMPIIDSIAEMTEAATPPLQEPMQSGNEVARLACSSEDVFVVDNAATATYIVEKLRGEYKHLVHACDTEVSDIDVKKESPVGHGKVICFSVYCGPKGNFGDGKSCIWVDTLNLKEDMLNIFKDYFEDSSIKKVWHNFSFDKHVLANHGIRVAGFHADTMHLARLWHSGRKGAEGSYSLESLTSDIRAMSGVYQYDALTITKKVSIVDLFGSRKLKKDGKEGCTRIVPPVEELQRCESMREKWICYSSADALCTWRLWESLQKQLEERVWYFQQELSGSMYGFYERYWKPFGELLVEMEGHGMLVDRDYLAEIEKVAFNERAISTNRFRKWAAKYCSCAQYINVTSDTQIRQLLYGGFEKVVECRTFKLPNIDGYIEEGKKAPLKYRTIKICGIGVQLPFDTVTSTGQPAVSMQALKNLAGKVSVDFSGIEDPEDFIPGEADKVLTSAGLEGSRESEEKKEEDLSVYGQAYHAFKGGQEGKEACKAIAALCEVSAIDTLISGFIKPLQGGDIMGLDNRVHCSLNLNTETGRLSARRPNLQNQPALEKDRYKIRQAFVASPGNSLIVADYGQLELRLLAHLADCTSMLEAFKIGGDFHSRTAMNMYSNVKQAVKKGEVLLEWEPKHGEDSPPSPLLKDVYGAERRKAKMLNFSIAYGKTAKGLARDWKVSMQEAQETVNLWYKDRPEVRMWQAAQKMSARRNQCVYTLLGRPRHFPDVKGASEFLRGRIDRAAINTPVQGSAADVAMLAMLEIGRDCELKRLGWKLLLQVHDEMILEGPAESAAYAKELVVKAMSHPFEGKNILKVDLVVDAKYASSWYAAK